MFDYETIPLHWVNRLSFLTRRELAQLFRDHGHDISAEEWAVLLILWKKGDQTPGEIADMTFRDRTTVTRLIDGMVKKQLVNRENDPVDRRRSILRVGAIGRALEKDLVPIARAFIAESLVGISPDDIQTTVRTLKKMTENLLPHRNTAPSKQSVLEH